MGDLSRGAAVGRDGGGGEATSALGSTATLPSLGERTGVEKDEFATADAACVSFEVTMLRRTGVDRVRCPLEAITSGRGKLCAE